MVVALLPMLKIEMTEDLMMMVVVVVVVVVVDE
jgi:hypothetical protein